MLVVAVVVVELRLLLEQVEQVVAVMELAQLLVLQELLILVAVAEDKQDTLLDTQQQALVDQELLS
jgi:hypothetical protein